MTPTVERVDRYTNVLTFSTSRVKPCAERPVVTLRMSVGTLRMFRVTPLRFCGRLADICNLPYKALRKTYMAHPYLDRNNL